MKCCYLVVGNPIFRICFNVFDYQIGRTNLVKGLMAYFWCCWEAHTLFPIKAVHLSICQYIRLFSHKATNHDVNAIFVGIVTSVLNIIVTVMTL